MITDQMIKKIKEITERDPSRSSLLSELRAACPDLIFRADADDNITGTDPVYKGDDFALYLIDTGNHCHTLTTDKEAATGVLIGIFSED